jgi:hypothetical protein
MIRWNGLDVAPDASQVLREIDPEKLIGPERSLMLWEDARRKEPVCLWIRMTTKLAMGAVFFVAEITEAFSHYAWTERVPKLFLRRAKPAHGLLGLSQE